MGSLKLCRILSGMPADLGDPFHRRRKIEALGIFFIEGCNAQQTSLIIPKATTRRTGRNGSSGLKVAGGIKVPKSRKDSFTDGQFHAGRRPDGVHPLPNPQVFGRPQMRRLSQSARKLEQTQVSSFVARHDHGVHSIAALRNTDARRFFDHMAIGHHRRVREHHTASLTQIFTGTIAGPDHHHRARGLLENISGIAMATPKHPTEAQGKKQKASAPQRRWTLFKALA